MRTIDVPYLVVGAGPAGLTAARLLARHGRQSLVVERRPGPRHHPAAHVVNARTLEIFRQAGFDMDAIAAVAKDPVDAGHVNFLTRLDGTLVGRLPFEQQGAGCEALTPTPLRNISQHRLEPILVDAAIDDPLVDLRFDMQWESSDQDDHGVTSIVEDRATGEQVAVRSAYVIAADGAGSRVRKSLGIEMEGPPNIDSFVAIHFGADLRPVVRERPGVLHFVLDPAISGVFIAHDIDHEWVFMFSFDPDAESADDYGPERCAEIVRAAIGRDGTGDDDIEIEIFSAGTWHMSAQVAERMRDGRTFLVGDAAHRFPPTGGLGLNTGVADVQALVWKLCAVEDGWAAPALLATYELERRPVAMVNCEQSTTNAFKLILLLEALDIAVDPTTERMHAALSDPRNRAAIDAAVAEQATHFDMLGLQLGHVYADGALARVGHAPPPLEDPRRFEPDASVGARVPHAWTTVGSSVLDLVATGALTLFTLGDHDRWAQACTAAEAPLVHVRVGIDTEVDASWRVECGLGADSALLVRPDQHIAWRADDAAADQGAALAAAVHHILER